MRPARTARARTFITLNYDARITGKAIPLQAFKYIPRFPRSSRIATWPCNL